jgi:Anti-sigma factor NepR
MINEQIDERAKPQPLGRDAQERIGAGLQAVYAEVEGEPLPNEQIDLLLALRRKERELERDRS